MSSPKERSERAGLLRLYVPEWQGYASHDGSRRGAELIREQICGAREFVDVGVAPIGPLPAEEGIVGREAIVRNTRACLEVLDAHRHWTIFTLGGTCAVELGPASYLNRLSEGEMAVVWLDAHGDLNTPATSPSGHFHGMPLRTRLGEGDPELVALSRPVITPRQVFLVGVRDLDPAEEDYVTTSGVSLLGAETTAEALIQQIEDRGFRRVYVHLDLDVLDPRDFDEVICPVPEGVRLERLLETLHELNGRLEVVGSSLLEFVPGANPRLDLIRRILDALEPSGGRRPGTQASS